MPLILKKKLIKVSENEMPFDGGVQVAEKPYSDEQFKIDLKTLASAAPKRAELAAEAKVLMDKVAEYDLQMTDINTRVKERLLQMFPVKENEEIERVVEGCHVKVSKDSQTRSIKDKEALIKALGQETFMKVADVKLGDIDKYTTHPEQVTFLEYGWTGRRKLVVTAVGKGTVVPAKKA